MGRPLVYLVALCLALTSARASELQREGRTRNHGHSVCSTWGDFHYKTFDGDIFRFPGLCDYNLASDCRDTYKEFALHLKRTPGSDGGHPQIEYILLTVKDDTIYLTRQLAVVNGAMVSTPHYSSGLLIEKSDAYTKVFSRTGLALMWDREDSLMPGTVYDDIAGGGCIAVSQCHCKLHGHLYEPGQQVTNDCEQCVCNAGRWVCKDLPCPGTCALEGGSHITTFDGKKYTFHGDCYYVLTKDDHNGSYALLGELAPCGSTDKQTCLKTVVLLTDKKKNVVAFKSDGSVLLNELQVNLPHVAASFSIFQPSSYHLLVNTAFGLRLQVQLLPVMQLFLTLDQDSQGQVQGLCGNFNGQESDDFKTAGGLVEATGAGFANTWKAQSSCYDKLDWLDDPCSLNIETANYAEHWCSLLKNTETPFGRCHSAVDPTEYYKRCRYDACSCADSEDCLCAALSSYARACAAKGLTLWGWRELVCNVDSCPQSQTFLYNLTTCQQTCRSLSESDTHCLTGFVPVDGCGCPDHTFLDEKSRCVPLAQCSCYHRGLYLEAGEVVLRQEERCVCQNGRLQCMQVKLLSQSCAAPKVHMDCSNLTALAIRIPRPVSCQTLAAGYYQTECISGCVCPEGLVDDGRGGCVVEQECPCMHNKDLYAPGNKIQVDCNTCTCQRGRWACTQAVCHGTCAIYGSGHYITFDGKYYDFDGHCSYVAAQDYCGQNSSLSSFSIITENVPCGTTGVTCSKAIKIFIGRTELKLEDKHRMVIQRDVGHHVAYTTREVGQYLVVETSTGIIVIWDKKTTIFIKLAPSYKGTVCGLCGNFDQRSNNDFTTRDHMVVESELDFGNSWKEAPTCPDVTTTPEPCTKNPHRRAWAEKQCSIIKSSVFSVCHSKVDPKPFYEACVHDSCSCDTGGDCECFCSAVASYAQECTKEGACVFWRTPDLCPIFCDYYNPPDECEWHYEPCGNRSFETCRTINGIHSNISVSYLEGCYPHCPEDRPIYDEDQKKCVARDRCGCYVEDTYYPPGALVPAVLTAASLSPTGKILNYTQDRAFCYWEICGPNGTVEKHFNVCTSSPPPLSSQPTPTMTPVPSTIPTTSATTTSTPTPSTVALTSPELCCFWSDWINENNPADGSDGDRETFGSVCQAPEDIQCRSATEPHLSWEELGQKAQCSVSFGFICKNEDQFGIGPFGVCYDYEIRVNCCLPMDKCPTPPTPSPTTKTSPTTTTETSTSATTSPTPTREPTTVTATTVTSTLTPERTTTVTTTAPTSTPCVDDCRWTGWRDSGKPSFTKPGGDFERIENVCQPDRAANISCRAAKFPDIPIEELGQVVVCDLSVGLVCKNQDQRPGGVIPQPYCLNYEINVYCCGYCASTPTPTPTITSTKTSTQTPTTTTTTETTTLTPTTSSTETPTPTPTTTSTKTPTPTTSSTEIPTPTPTTSSTETPTPTPTTTSTKTPTPTTSSTETPTSTPTTTSTETSTPIPTSTTTTGTPIPTPTITSTKTPTPTITSTKTSTPTTTTTTETPTPTPTTSSTKTPTPTTSSTRTPKTPPPTSTTTSTEIPTPTITSTKTSTLTPTMTTTTETTTPTPTSSSTETPTPTPATTTTKTPTATTCCELHGEYYAPGELVYNGTHGGICYYVNCSLVCTLEFYNWSCPSSPSPTLTPSTPTPSATPSASTPTTLPSTAPSTSATTKPPACPDFDPPRQENETWWLCNCTKAICKHGTTVELVEVECKPPPMPTCSNSLTPVRVLDPDGCCWHWECDCYCTGWGDPHYVTFDGLYYSYQGNCTYVLVEEITPTVDNFGVYIDNYHCDVNDQVSCPRTLIVRHETQEVLVKTVSMSPMKVQVQINRQVVALPYRKYGLQVYESGINYVVAIPELDARISYNGLSFSIRLPHRLFGNNTKGQCGTCTNSTEDDCALPSGEVISDCEVAADAWVVNDPTKPRCPHTGFTTRRPASTPSRHSGTTSLKGCASPLCELIKDSLFAPCHTLVPPQYYYEACVFDSCFVPSSGLECASLQAYAALCAQEGACVDWRNHTHGACSVTCPPHREYRPCGPAEESTCKSSPSQNETHLVEGCFCPEGTISYAPGFDICVDICGCVGPDNVPREFGEHFEFDCKECVCLEGGSGIVCQPKRCSQRPPAECTEDGTHLVTQVDFTDTCCNVTFCKCNASLCKEKPPVCPLGFDMKSEMVPGRCCPFYSCVPKGVCVHENAEYQPGSPVYSKCQNCVCTNTTDSATQLHIVSCTHVPCSTTCSQGFELVDVPGECCQKCEQTHCIINRPGGQHLILKPGDISNDPETNCTFFSCVKIHNQLISSVSNISCPDFDPSICLPGSITFMPNGCCKKCIPRNETRIPCSTIPVTRDISDAGCNGTITTNYCSGSCGTFAMYSAEAQALDHKCSCCKEEQTHQREAVLSCPDGSSRKHTYTHIESCLCQDTTCELVRAQRAAPSRARRSGPQALRPGRG
ncbi:mucin-2 [Pteropus vampyrus]|uniref:Mucin-2 n=1 Tax=Pteropus vampyrus TaxID=132908 RepID=A0A6P3RSX4_PTEVA|nr:mucin-2 [Pteropus vampyrus]